MLYDQSKLQILKPEELRKSFREDYAPPKKRKPKSKGDLSAKEQEERDNIQKTKGIEAARKYHRDKVHNDLPPGGQWITSHGHHIYIKDGKVLAGAIPANVFTGSMKNMSPADMRKHQARMDKESAAAKPKEAAANKPKKAAKGAPPKKDLGVPAESILKPGEKKLARKVAFTVDGHEGAQFERSSDNPYTHAVVGEAKDGRKYALSFHRGAHNAQSALNTAANQWNKDTLTVHPVVVKHADAKKLGASEAKNPAKGTNKNAKPKKKADGKGTGKPSANNATVRNGSGTGGATKSGKSGTSKGAPKAPVKTSEAPNMVEVKGMSMPRKGAVGMGKRQLYKDQFGYYVKKGGRFAPVEQNAKGEWATTRGGMPVADADTRRKKHDDKANRVAEASEGGKADGVAKRGTKRVAKASEAPAPKSAGTKKPTVGKAKAPTADGGKGKAKASATKPPKKAVADVRHEAQANRALAYDVGDKVGGARKDMYTKSFTAEPTAQNLEALEKEAPEVAQRMCVKKNILPPVDFEAEHKNGVEIDAAMLKQLIFDRIAPKPQGDRAEDRMSYLQGIRKLHRVIAPIKTWDELRKAVSELGTIAHAGNGLDGMKQKVSTASQHSYFNHDYYNERIAKATEAKKMLDFEALGDKLNNFFTSSESRFRTFQTIHDKRLNWDSYFKPSEEKDAKEGRQVTRGAGKAKWERMAVSEHQRKGGKETTVKKPEDMVKQFGMKGVEFGNWVDDSAGLYHLKRSAESFHDLADVLGVDDKDVSLNGRLSMAFGARGKAGALAHYEPDRKVINMTKHGGAGSLAHEWGHALDNIMYMYSHGGVGSMGLASDAVNHMGDHDPQLNGLYSKLMDAIRKPTPGQPGGVRKVSYDTEANQFGSYYPEMRRDIRGGMSMQDTMHKWSTKFQSQFDASMRALDSMKGRFTPKELDKRVLKAQRELKNNLRDLPHRVAQELKSHQGGDHIRGTLEMPTADSEYLTRMREFDGSGKAYYAEGCEMFARVFESLIEDKLTAKKRMNNYLVWDTKTSKGNLDAPFPVGEERKHMHQAMDELLKYIAKNKTLKKALEMELQKGVGLPPMLADFMVHLTSGTKDQPRLLNEDELRKRGKEAMEKDPELAQKARDYEARLAAMKERRDPEGIEKAFVESEHPRDEAGRFHEAIVEHNGMLTKFGSRFGSAEEFAEAVNRPGFGGKSVSELFEMIDNNSHNHLDADAIKTYLSEGGDFYYLTHVDPHTLDVQDEGHLEGIHSTPFDQSTAKPIVVGQSNFIVDGRHRTVNAKQSGAPRIQAYVPAKHYYNLHIGSNPLRKSVIPDPTGGLPVDPYTMYRGVGQKELDFIQKNGFVQSKGKGNDADQGKVITCFTQLFSQAEGYARSNYTLYGEEAAYVIALPKPPWVYENDLGELESDLPVPFAMGVVIPIPKPDEVE